MVGSNLTFYVRPLVRTLVDTHTVDVLGRFNYMLAIKGLLPSTCFNIQYHKTLSDVRFFELVAESSIRFSELD